MARDDYQAKRGLGHRPERRISVRGVRRAEPDLRKLAQALIALAQAQAEADAKAAHEQSACDVSDAETKSNPAIDGTIVPKEAA